MDLAEQSLFAIRVTASEDVLRSIWFVAASFNETISPKKRESGGSSACHLPQSGEAVSSETASEIEVEFPRPALRRLVGRFEIRLDEDGWKLVREPLAIEEQIQHAFA
jgi:hypothetical protein